MEQADLFVAPDEHLLPFGAISDCLERMDGKALSLVARSGRLVAASPSALALYQAATHLRIEGGYLEAACRAEGARLKPLLSVQGDSVEILVLHSEAPRRPLVVRACAFKQDLVLLSVASTLCDSAPVLPDLEQLFDLTPSEARIVQDLYQGHTPQWIAKDLSNSIHTIRAHIRQCYHKLGVRCREELWNTLNIYRIR